MQINIIKSNRSENIKEHFHDTKSLWSLHNRGSCVDDRQYKKINSLYSKFKLKKKKNAALGYTSLIKVASVSLWISYNAQCIPKHWVELASAVW